MNIWYINGSIYKMGKESKTSKKLENNIYILGVDNSGFHLDKVNDAFNFNYKIYGLEESLIKRCVKAYQYIDGNLGILFSGLKGTGKTVTAKIIANKLNLPIILIQNKYDGISEYINSIKQDVVIMIDEYEKIFGDSHKLLTLMDGVMDNGFKKVFLLTSNSPRVNENMLERPTRIRYYKNFESLSHEVIEEIVDDLLKYKKLRKEVINFIITLNTITIDIVKSVINEVNIFNESPLKFKDIFNVVIKSGSYNIFEIIEDKEILLYKSVECYPKSFDNKIYHLDSLFYADNKELGTITNILDKNLFELSISTKSKNKTKKEEIIKKIIKISPAIVYNNNYAFKEAIIK